MDVKTIAAWAPIGSLVVAMLLGFFQLRKLVQSIQSQTYQRVYETMISLDRFFMENPALKRYVYGPAPEDNVITPTKEVDGKNLFSVAEMVVDYFDNVFHQRKCMPRGTFLPFCKFMRRTCRESELIKEFLKQRGDWYPLDFRAHLAGRKTWCEWKEESLFSLKSRFRGR